MKKMIKILSAVILSLFVFTACENNDGPIIHRMEEGKIVVYSGKKPAKGLITNTINDGTDVIKVSEVYVDKGVPAKDFKLYATDGKTFIEGKGKWKDGMFEGEITGHNFDFDDNLHLTAKGTFKFNPDVILRYRGDFFEALEVVETIYDGVYDSNFRKYSVKKGKLDGEALEYTPYDAGGEKKYYLSLKGTYKDDKKEGKFTEYNISGMVVSEKEYKNDELNGKVLNYDEEGNLKTESEFKDGKRNGLFTKYYPDKKVQYTVVFKDDKLEGPYKEYYENGKLNISSSFKNGEQDGVREIFGEDGHKLGEETYVKGELQGKFCEYDENGNKKKEGTIEYGKLHGPVTFYKNGIRHKTVNYTLGYEDGMSYEYNNKGVLVFSAEWVKGQKTSNCVWYDKDGNKVQEYMGNIRTTYYPNGNKRTEGKYTDRGDRVGYYIEYYENGNKKYEAQYYYDLFTNVKYYTEDGKLKSKK